MQIAICWFIFSRWSLNSALGGAHFIQHGDFYLCKTPHFPVYLFSKSERTTKTSNIILKNKSDWLHSANKAFRVAILNSVPLKSLAVTFEYNSQHRPNVKLIQMSEPCQFQSTSNVNLSDQLSGYPLDVQNRVQLFCQVLAAAYRPHAQFHAIDCFLQTDPGVLLHRATISSSPYAVSTPR